MDLSDIRKKIDDIDQKLLPLFLERMQVSAEVAAYKKANNLPVLNKQRERDILKWVRAESGDMELYADRLYNTIFELSRAYQDELLSADSPLMQEIEAGLRYRDEPFPTSGRIACQGVEGAYGQMAADKMFPRGDLTFMRTFEGVFDAVGSGLCDFGVLPVENSSNGSVRMTYDLLRTKNVKIIRSERLCIRHQLLAKPGTKLSDITEIHSHEQALGQCSRFIKSLGTAVKAVPCLNTAIAAEYVASSSGNIACIASAGAGELNGLVPIADSIQDSDNNYTRFICIARDTRIYAGADRISLILTCRHKPGALYEILAKLAAVGINLIKLESCPLAGSDFEFVFFFDLQASVMDQRTIAVLQSIERSCESFIFLGNYREA